MFADGLSASAVSKCAGVVDENSELSLKRQMPQNATKRRNGGLKVSAVKFVLQGN
jgi:hypothetical protein